MNDFSSCRIESAVFHYVGNKCLGHEIKFSENEMILNDLQKEHLNVYFMGNLKQEMPFYNFVGYPDLDYNTVFRSVRSIFNEKQFLVEESKKIAEVLWEKSEHPKVNGGEFFVVYITNCIVEDEICDAIGIFKSENKDTFIKVFQDFDNTTKIDSDKAINIKKLDKGCFVFKTEENLGYKIAVIDNNSKTSQYWFEFLNIEQRKDNFYNTRYQMVLAKKYSEEIQELNGASNNEERLKYIEKVENYFSQNESFDYNEFTDEVFDNDEEKIEEFESFSTKFQEENDIKLKSQFPLSNRAVKDNKKIFKRTLKLDDNFIVDVKDIESQNIEQGFDEERGKSFYKLYFFNQQMK